VSRHRHRRRKVLRVGVQPVGTQELDTRSEHASIVNEVNEETHRGGGGGSPQTKGGKDTVTDMSMILHMTADVVSREPLLQMRYQ
jgi:hypothetical protein